ncbi:hypothetical protein CI109_100355 [Kwoniella shandongensis]|uniref:Uncharacterized protein n=1 Tax=Kwoniella shandongensis TaxID=1734106 RepID=A0AAJ8LCK6_9TREE
MALPVDSMGPLRDSPPPMDYEEGKVSGVTRTELIRRRRCEPSPLVSPDHPDAARLPCARCRRFATECVRIKAARRKGPAPVAISDAVHGYRRGTPEAIRRLSGLSEVTTMVDSDRQGSTSGHRVFSYAGLDPIETEIRRRMYWDLPLPAEVDDEQITLKGILSGSGVTPLITGFNVVTELVRWVTGQVWANSQNPERCAHFATTEDATEHVGNYGRSATGPHDEAEDYRYGGTCSRRVEAAEGFRCEQGCVSVPKELSLTIRPAVDWEQKLRERFESYYEGPHASNSYLVMQMLLAQWAMFTPIAPQDFGYEEQAEDIACELLNGLNRQTLLMQFLSVLSVIEGMYTFGKDIATD